MMNLHDRVIVTLPENCSYYKISNNLITTCLIYKNKKGEINHIDLGDCRTSFAISKHSDIVVLGNNVIIFRTTKGMKNDMWKTYYNSLKVNPKILLI